MTPPRINLPRETVEAALEAARTASRHSPYPADWEPFAELAGGLLAALAAPPEQPQHGKWIACAERLPEVGKSVLCLWDNADVRCQAVAYISKYGQWLDPFDGLGMTVGAPDYWQELQPLPAPPPAQ